MATARAQLSLLDRPTPVELGMDPKFPLICNGQYRRKDDGSWWRCVAAETTPRTMSFQQWWQKGRGKKGVVTYRIRDAVLLFEYVPTDVEAWA